MKSTFAAACLLALPLAFAAPTTGKQHRLAQPSPPFSHQQIGECCLPGLDESDIASVVELMSRGRYEVSGAGLVVSKGRTHVEGSHTQLMHTGSGAALTLEEVAAVSVEQLDIRRVGSDRQGSGLVLAGVVASSFRSLSIEGFGRGLYLNASKPHTEIQHNYYYDIWLHDNLVGLEASGPGRIAENSFFGGRVSHGDLTGTTGSRLVELRNSGSGTDFYSFSLETGAPVPVDHKVFSDGMDDVQFFACRWEGSNGVDDIQLEAGDSHVFWPGRNLSDMSIIDTNSNTKVVPVTCSSCP